MDYTKLAPPQTVAKTAEGLKPRGFEPIVVENGAKALELIKTSIPKGASVMNGASTTLEQIGFIDYLKSGEHGWVNLHAQILAEKDKEKQAQLRKYSVVSDYYLGSAHVITEGGEMVFSSNSGSQMPHLVYTSQNLILVVSTKKIVPTLQDAFDRIDKHIVPLEDQRMMKLYGIGTRRNKTVILHSESEHAKRSVKVLLVNEDLGF